MRSPVAQFRAQRDGEAARRQSQTQAGSSAGTVPPGTMSRPTASGTRGGVLPLRCRCHDDAGGGGASRTEYQCFDLRSRTVATPASLASRAGPFVAKPTAAARIPSGGVVRPTAAAPTVLTTAKATPSTSTSANAVRATTPPRLSAVSSSSPSSTAAVVTPSPSAADRQSTLLQSRLYPSPTSPSPATGQQQQGDRPMTLMAARRATLPTPSTISSSSASSVASTVSEGTDHFGFALKTSV